MYLDARCYIPFQDRGEKIRVLGLAGLDRKRLKYISQEVGYWRKANAIHSWFVANVQNGEDDYRAYEVSKADLSTLKEVCVEMLKYKPNAEKLSDKKVVKKIEKLLPTANGFFFGSDEYDRWYFEALENTIEIVDRCLKLPSGWYFEYCSSW